MVEPVFVAIQADCALVQFDGTGVVALLFQLHGEQELVEGIFRLHFVQAAADLRFALVIAAALVQGYQIEQGAGMLRGQGQRGGIGPFSAGHVAAVQP